jgi:hypothetical protein
MTVYALTKAKENLEALLEEAYTNGEVHIERQDGQLFVIKPASSIRSPLDVQGIDLGLSAEDIVKFVREGRER